LPFFNLDKIRVAASLQQIEYAGCKVRKDIANLGYTLEVVADSIASLTPTDFQKTIVYPDQTAHDVYIKNVIREEQTDKIYMKLGLLDNGEIEIVEIGSFHL
jgi:hypothetical protein